MGPPVRELPADSGFRTLPILHFYGSVGVGHTIPVAVDVAFTQGVPSVWYPQVDDVRLGDETGELAWERLALSTSPTHSTQTTTDVTWPDAMREIDALWVNSDTESERFVFYEADTAERSLLTVERGDTWSEERGHYLLRNGSAFDVHDVFVMHTDGDDRFVFFAPRIPGGTTAGFLLEEHAVDADDYQNRTVGALAARLIDEMSTVAPTETRRAIDDCVMMRDPSVPETTVTGHRLHAEELNAMLDIWKTRFFEAEGTTIVYRESTEYLQAMMPLGIYTDMLHYPVINRLGLAVWEGVVLP